MRARDVDVPAPNHTPSSRLPSLAPRVPSPRSVPSTPLTQIAPARLIARRKLGGTVSIVGNDVDEEVVQRGIPSKTPGTKAKPLRAPLRERTNKNAAANVTARKSSRGSQPAEENDDASRRRQTRR